ncbi:MAG TPA: UDP-2,3-diacylglucosamine diphosphatase [Bacteroidales bacterium]|nr:UDP-2,3-diacylglucosamine diphosphatase [Bacteroidales bacterium]
MSTYYFVADIHLGLRNGDPSDREARFIAFLDSLAPGTGGLFLLGDIFDFWYEYKYVIPRGYTRTLGALARVHDRGIPVHFFVGNHDLWTYGYLEQELGMQVHRDEWYVKLEGKYFLLAHGHRMGRQPCASRFLHGMFHNRLLQVLFSCLHPRWAFALARKWSAWNRDKHNGSCKQDMNLYKPVYQYAATYDRPVDYCITGHIHTSVRCPLPAGGELIVLEDWLSVGPSGPVRGDIGIFRGTEKGEIEIIKAPVVVHAH